MSSQASCCHSNSTSEEATPSSPPVDEESKFSNNSMTLPPLHKHVRRNIVHDTLALMLQNDGVQQESDEQYRSDSVRILQESVNAVTSFVITMTLDIRDMQGRVATLENCLSGCFGFIESQLPGMEAILLHISNALSRPTSLQLMLAQSTELLLSKLSNTCNGGPEATFAQQLQSYCTGQTGAAVGHAEL
ncbi:uncharacterized protein MEPE_00317 [Melanopsichium pennsylvanicum]|uniref:Uncharacterized protein n=1 Tax=Melanopsichium pennsylvanicum TaxID=63383 RepID=A0AAJ4XGE1_9BASI|nr:uncharacterized protein MEPE_00317 [Melanopsichium pennsylvanicum]